ncbi:MULTISPECIES: nuclear transport factor 2 family protein [unclassified Flammeovirga]|uniref:nuclear transport factor 2 family protein n=1 Tax=unclassified Flammeovirga TaxID=2637820 RepID=UPI0005C53A36|nr:MULTISPECIES: nuclear transport factor 2 family protein [unclassified Flammeovirga]MBD0403805.1 nuclear transport factor 2 family protein [Flammeovirga sp. EKP202]
MKKEHLAKKLLKWNQRHLLSSTHITKSDIAQCFAPDFVVKVNGREYQVNYESYLEFLTHFKSNIQSINYEVQEYVCAEDRVVAVMNAIIVRKDHSIDKFETMLLLKFDDSDLITLWQEVYTKKN